MAKKKTAKKKTTKKITRSTPSKKSAGGKSARPAAKKTTKKTVKKAATKKVTKKPTKKVAKKTTKKTTKKVTKTVTKKVVKKVAKKPAAKKTTTKKPTAKKTTTKKAPPKPVSKTTKKTTKKAPTKAPAKPAAKGGKPDPKGTPPAKNSGPIRRRRPSKVKKPLILPDRPLLMGPNSAAIKPLIPSGSKVKKKKSVLDNVTSRRTKTPLTKTQLENYRHVLLVKRAELMGDVRHIEEEVLKKDPGAASSSQNIEEQGSESYEQSLNMNLAASDRERIIEIDDALKRIVDRTFGLCELTHEPIKKARLDELPWARFTIHAARELDRRGGNY